MARSEDILLGIDFGTGGCKVTAVYAESGAVAAEASVEYPTEYARAGWSEQNPADWYAAMCRALSLVAQHGVNLKAVRAAALDGSTHNAVLLGADMKPVRKTIMWTDQRSAPQCARLKEKFGDKIFQTAYQMPAPTWTLPQMMWLSENEPEVLPRVKRVLFVKDYVRYLLTGVACTDYIEAQGTLFFDMKNMRWSEELAELSGLPFSSLPELVKPADVVGKITARASADTGLPEGMAIVCGTSDSAVEDYGAGAIRPGDCIIKLATAGNVNVMTAEPRPSATTLTYSHVVEGMWYTVSATNAAALCLRWFRDAFCGEEKSAAEKTGEKVFALIDALAEKSPAGANGVMFHPYLQGERSPYWDANLRASFTGVSISSTKGDFIRALMEGVAFSLKDCYGSIEKMGLGVERIFLIGGGARGKLWSKIIADVFGLAATVPIPGDASYGSALLAGVGAGLFATPSEAVSQCLKFDRVVEPDAASARAYSELFEKYKAAHDALAPVYSKYNLSKPNKE